MKKLLFLLLALLPICGMAQQKKVASIEVLNANPKFGGIVLGDSVIHYLTKLDLLEEKGGGMFKCEADRDEPTFRLGGVAPISVYVQTEKHRIKNIYAAYPHGNADDLVNALIKKYGKYSDFSDGSYNWYGKNVFVMTGKSGNNTSFVVYTYVVPMK